MSKVLLIRKHLQGRPYPADSLSKERRVLPGSRDTFKDAHGAVFCPSMSNLEYDTTISARAKFNCHHK